MQQGGVAIGIDFGELTTGLSSIMGIGRGIASKRQLGRAISEITRSAEREFGRLVDADSNTAHVYEYGMEGNPSGRLWSMNWQQRRGDMVGNIHFRTARKPTRPGAGIDEQLSRSAGAAGRSLAQHYFPDKAAHLETTKTLVSVAGVQKYTRRVGGDVPKPRSLVFIEGGSVVFRQRRVQQNEFYGKFRSVFAAYWGVQLEAKGSHRVRAAFRSTAGFSSTQVNRRVRGARAMSRPRIPVGRSGVFVTDRGRPFTGYRMRETEVKRTESAVADKLRKELVTRWLR